MKEKIKEFFAKCGMRREKTPPDDPGMARYHEIYKAELEWVKKNPEMAAHIFAGDREEQLLADADAKRNSVEHDMERRSRTERIMSCGRPSAMERCPEKDGPDLDRD